MDSYIGWIAAVLTVGVLYIFSCSGYSLRKKRRKADQKREKKYASIAGQFKRCDKDQEYIRIRQKIWNELIRCSDEEKRGILAKKLYGLKEREAHHEKMTFLAIGITAPLVLTYVYFADQFMVEYITEAVIVGLPVLIVYIILICFVVLRKSNLSKLIYITEDMLAEIDATGYEKQSGTVTEDLDALIRRLKEN